MDEELYLLYQSQLCSLLAQREIICQNIILGSGQNARVNLMIARIDEQVERLRAKGVSL